jgi:hypothetical protein
VDVFLTRIGPSGQARLVLVSRGSNFDVAMAATIYWSVRPAEAQGKPGESSAVLEPQRSAYSRSFWDGPASSNQSASEKVLSASDRTRISVSVLSFGLCVAILWALASFISAVLEWRKPPRFRSSRKMVHRSERPYPLGRAREQQSIYNPRRH